eukprot:CAMPEP_0114989854 /NCGR_PEP_ID=MMETSP0216-20121206/10436_1 /TAXON_ID=223996 /ORGANISM="Protocruzia adherens, Strain Boccale" /LENGTH=359 /DNA_ID=CAMNT_0002352893 /DNA_START=54 /DNA_END=1133 /DNA_ORIENTATION=-
MADNSDSSSIKSVYQSASGRAVATKVVTTRVEKYIAENTADFNSTTPFRIAEYGSKDGTTTVAIVREIITLVRSKNADKAIEVYCNDKVTADFNKLLKTVNELKTEFTNVQVYAVADCFYKSLFPVGSIDVGISFTSVHWLSKVPCFLESRLYTPFGLDQVAADTKQKWETQARDDWRLFLENRQKELKTGGVFYITTLGFPTPHSEEHLTHSVIHSALMADLVAVLEKHGIAEHKSCFNSPMFYRQREHYMNALEGDNKVGFTLEKYDDYTLELPVFTELAAKNDKEGIVKVFVSMNEAGATPYYKTQLAAITTLTEEQREGIMGEIRATWEPTFQKHLKIEDIKNVMPFNELLLSKN